MKLLLDSCVCEKPGRSCAKPAMTSCGLVNGKKILDIKSYWPMLTRKAGFWLLSTRVLEN